MEDQTLTCQKCSRVYVYNHQNTKGHTKVHCNSCKVNFRRFAFKDKCLEYKGGKCERCGYNRCKRVLSFHHTDPTRKDFQISGNHARKWETVKAELDKCLLLCMNCHLEEHEELDNREVVGSNPTGPTIYTKWRAGG